MKKLILTLFMLATMFYLTDLTKVNAHAYEIEPYYVNNNGIEMSEENYNMLSNFYSHSVIENMTIEKYQTEISNEYNLYSSKTKYIRTRTLIDSTGKVLDSIDYEISELDYNRAIVPFAWCGPGHQCWETTYKIVTLSIWSYVDNPSALRLVLVNDWKIMPATRSFDVIYKVEI